MINVISTSTQNVDLKRMLRMSTLTFEERWKDDLQNHNLSWAHQTANVVRSLRELNSKGWQVPPKTHRTCTLLCLWQSMGGKMKRHKHDTTEILMNFLKAKCALSREVSIPRNPKHKGHLYFLTSLLTLGIIPRPLLGIWERFGLGKDLKKQLLEDRCRIQTLLS